MAIYLAILTYKKKNNFYNFLWVISKWQKFIGIRMCPNI